MSAGSYCKKVGWGQQKPPLGYQLDRSSPFARDIFGCWLFNEKSGARYNDLANPDTDLAANTALWTPDGLYGNSAVSALPLSQQHRINAPLTLIAFINEYAGNPTAFSNIFGADYASGDTLPYNCYKLYYGDASTYYVGLAVNCAGTQKTLASTYKLPAGKQMVWGIHTGSTLSLGVNTTQLNSTSTGITAPINYIADSRYKLGNHNATISALVFSRALSRDEISYLYANPYAMVEGYNLGRFFSISSGINYIPMMDNYYKQLRAS
jgi:hypothetical protein